MPELIACPHCQGQSQWTPELAGRVVQCPHCRNQFQLSAQPPSQQASQQTSQQASYPPQPASPPAPAAPRGQAPPPLPQKNVPAQASPRPVPAPGHPQTQPQGYPQHAPPGGIEQPGQTRRASRAEVKGKVFVPGLVMLILNGLGALGAVIAGGIIMLRSSFLDAAHDSIGMDLQIALLAFLSVSFFFQSYVAYGGYELMNVRNYNTCFMAAVLSILCTGQCFGILAGVWALIVLNQKDVKSAMSLGSTKRFRR